MFILPLVVAAVASIRSFPHFRGVVGCVWYEVAVSMVTLMVAIVPVVSVCVVTGHPCVIGVREGATVLVVWRCTPSEALTQGELGRQLPDGLPLVQDGLFLLDEALPEMEDGGFGFFACPPPASRRCTLMSGSSRTCWPSAWSCCIVAGRVCIHRNRSAYKAWVGSVIIVRV